MAEKLLITGATGFIGYHLINHALDAGIEVTAVTRTTSNTQHLKGLDLKLVAMDFHDKGSITRILEKGDYDYVIHAAGATKAGNRDDYNLANVASTKNLAEAVLSYPIKKFLLMSSLAAAGPIGYHDPDVIRETTIPHPLSNYGRSKLRAEQKLMEFTSLPWLILRPTAVYGPRERDLFIMFKTLDKGLEPYIGSREQWLSFVYVKDLAALTVKALQSNFVQQMYTISDGNAYTRYDLADRIKKTLGIKTIKFRIPLPVVQVLASCMEYISGDKTPALNREKIPELTAESWQCSIEKAVKDFGYAPRYNLERGIEETVKWYKQNNWL